MTTVKEPGALLSGFTLLVTGLALVCVALGTLLGALAVYGVSFSLAIILTNALLHFYVGSAWLGIINTLVIGFTLSLIANILRKVL